MRPGSTEEDRRAAEEWGHDEMRRLVVADYQGEEADEWNLFVLDGLPAWQKVGTMRGR